MRLFRARNCERFVMMSYLDTQMRQDCECMYLATPKFIFVVAQSRIKPMHGLWLEFWAVSTVIAQNS
jgi:hypothetical protein